MIKFPFKLPDLVLVHVDLAEGARIEYVTDLEEFFTWKGELRKATPAWLRREIECWVAIQRERKRLGLEYLSEFEPMREDEPTTF